MVTTTADAVILVIGIWNKIAEFTGSLIDTTEERLEVVTGEFRAPRWIEFFYAVPYWKEQIGVVAAYLAILNGSIREWGIGVRDIVYNATQELPFPKSLKSKVMRGDVAANFVIQELLGIADSISASDPKETVEIILEVANASAYNPLDPNDIPESIPTTKQQIWKTIVTMAVSASVMFLPFAVAWVAAIFYIRVWDGQIKSPTLSQNSKRVTSKAGPSRHRVNLRPGPD
uniref:Uncharacterized protein n=1 Tax=uncultured prokaryote TaxID=198431 RepID=A0A0H5Q508_9ZZZZ|nr:hypothetical protein [uncultured prokaryote]